jgi:SAM-dependent methyltransferase
MVNELAPPGGLVCDVGCGGGTMLAELQRNGFALWGSDLSPAMVALARQRLGPHVPLLVADALDVPIPPCDVVTAVGEVLGFAVGHGDARRVEPFLRRVHEALRPGGFLLFDVATQDKAQGDRTVERAGRGWRLEARIEVDGTRLTRTIDTWREVRGQTRHAREVHRQRLFEADWLVASLEDFGFTVERLGGYDDYGFQEGWDGLLARKASA